LLKKGYPAQLADYFFNHHNQRTREKFANEIEKAPSALDVSKIVDEAKKQEEYALSLINMTPFWTDQ
jgi:hypothetical protein